MLSEAIPHITDIIGATQKAYRSTPNCQNLPAASHFTHPRKFF